MAKRKTKVSRSSVQAHVPGATGVGQAPVDPPTFTPAPAAPAAPPPTVDPANLPVDPIYDQTIAALQKARDDLLAQITGQRKNTLLDFGFSETGMDASGNPQVAFDPTNPNSRAALLKQSYDRNQRATGTSYASQGQLYSGALGNAQAYNSRQNDVAADAQLKQLQQYLAGNTAAGTQARTSEQLSEVQAEADRLARAVANNRDPGVAPATAPAPAFTPIAATPVQPSATARRLGLAPGIKIKRPKIPRGLR